MEANGNIWDWAGKYHLNVHSVWRSSSFQSSVDVLDLGTPAGRGRAATERRRRPLRESFAGQGFRVACAVEKPLASAIRWKRWCGLSRWRMRWFGQRWRAEWAGSHIWACTCGASASPFHNLHCKIHPAEPVSWKRLLPMDPGTFIAVLRQKLIDFWMFNPVDKASLTPYRQCHLYPTAWAMLNWVY